VSRRSIVSGRRRSPPLGFPLLLVIGLAGGCWGGAARMPEPREAPATSGASFTAAQAIEGERIFNGVCSACHRLGEFRGRMFEITWMARPVGDFYQHISVAMPEDRPGTLQPDEYVAIVAYLLQLNGRTAGSSALPADAGALAAVRWKD